MKYILVLLTILAISTQFSQAQESYVVMNSGDTVFGKFGMYHDKIITFTPKDGQRMKYLAQDIKSAYNGKKSLKYIQINNINDENGEPILLQSLTSGPIYVVEFVSRNVGPMASYGTGGPGIGINVSKTTEVFAITADGNPTYLFSKDILGRQIKRNHENLLKLLDSNPEIAKEIQSADNKKLKSKEIIQLIERFNTSQSK